jgi:signal transduction histidine kinase
VSRLQTGKFLIEKATFDARDIVQQEVKELDLLATSHELKLRLNVGKEPLMVHADADKLRQVMMNFIDNAIFYSRNKGTIIINLEKVKNDVAFTVVDSGIGVPEDEQAKLFTKFFRAKNARQQRPDGTGVGLYLARRVISAHDGKILFSSKEGKGSTFGFRLPLELAPQPVAKTAAEPALETAAK